MGVVELELLSARRAKPAHASEGSGGAGGAGVAEVEGKLRLLVVHGGDSDVFHHFHCYLRKEEPGASFLSSAYRSVVEEQRHQEDLLSANEGAKRSINTPLCPRTDHGSMESPPALRTCGTNSSINIKVFLLNPVDELHHCLLSSCSVRVMSSNTDYCLKMPAGRIA